MQKAEKSSARLNFVSSSRDRPSREVLAKHSIWKILSVTFLPFAHTIYILIIHKSRRGYSKRKPLDKFSITQHTHLSERESYLSLVRNPCSLFSFPLPLSCLERKFVPKHNSHISKCRKCFGAWEALGICQKKPVRLSGCNRAYCGIWKAREDMTLRNPLVAGA